MDQHQRHRVYLSNFEKRVLRRLITMMEHTDPVEFKRYELHKLRDRLMPTEAPWRKIPERDHKALLDWAVAAVEETFDAKQEAIEYLDSLSTEDLAYALQDIAHHL